MRGEDGPLRQVCGAVAGSARSGVRAARSRVGVISGVVVRGWTLDLLRETLRLRVASARLRLATALLWCGDHVAGSVRASAELEALSLAAFAVESSAFWQGRAVVAEAEIAERDRPADPERMRAAIDELAYAAGMAQVHLMRANALNN